jgi:hypothetical protein
MTYAPAPCKKRKERGTQILIPICQGPGHPPSYFQTISSTTRAKPRTDRMLMKTMTEGAMDAVAAGCRIRRRSRSPQLQIRAIR